MDNCIFTGLPISVQVSSGTFYYNLSFAGRNSTIFVCNKCEDRILNSKLPPPHVVLGLIANDIWPKRAFIIDSKHNRSDDPSDSVRINIDDFFNTLNYPKDPIEKTNNLILGLVHLQKIDGERIYINLTDDKNWAVYFFKSREECFVYFKGLHEKGYIELIDNGYGDRGVSFRITHSGLIKATELTKAGLSENSNFERTCFIAMSFDPSLLKIRNAIKSTVTKNGFRPVIIDEENISSQQTIPDAIMSSIKKSTFVIADFTLQSKGVYFEGAFGSGLGKKVIYTCEKTDFDSNSHFDVKQLQHIIYENEGDLNEKLDKKIKSWILIQ